MKISFNESKIRTSNIKNKYQIGDILKVIEQGNGVRYFTLVKIENIVDKKLYNMYICKNIKTNCKVTLTDLDVCCKVRYPRRIRNDA